MRFLASKYRLIICFLPLYIGGMTMTLPIYSQKSISKNLKKTKRTKQKSNVLQWGLLAGTIAVFIGGGIVYVKYGRQTSPAKLPRKPLSPQEKKKQEEEEWKREKLKEIEKELKDYSDILAIYKKIHNISDINTYISCIKKQYKKKHTITFDNYFINDNPNIKNSIDYWFQDYFIEEFKENTRTRPIKLNDEQFFTRKAFFEKLQSLNLDHSPKTERRIITLSSHGVSSRFLSIISSIYIHSDLNITVSPLSTTSFEAHEGCSVTTEAQNTWEVTYSFNSNIWENIFEKKKIAKIKIEVKFSSDNPEKATCTWEVVPLDSTQ